MPKLNFTQVFLSSFAFKVNALSGYSQNRVRSEVEGFAKNYMLAPTTSENFCKVLGSIQISAYPKTFNDLREMSFEKSLSEK